MKLSIRTKLLLAFLGVAFLIVVVGGIALWNLTKIDQGVKTVAERDLPRLIQADNAKMQLLVLRRMEKNFLMERNELQKERFRQEYENTKGALVELQKNAISEDGKKDMAAAMEALENYKALMGKAEILVAEGKFAEAQNMSLTEMRDAGNIIETSITNVMDRNRVRIETSVQDAERIVSNSIKLMIVLSVIVLVLAVVIALYISRGITRSIQALVEISQMAATGDLTREARITTKDEIGLLGDNFNSMIQSLRKLISEVIGTSSTIAASSQELNAASEETSRAVGQVAETTGDIAKGADHASKNMEMVAQSMNELAAAMEQMAAAADQLNGNSKEMGGVAEEGSRAVNRAVEKMNLINQTVVQSGDVVRELGVRSGKIGEIVGVITAIADQTNLLALNAAIEAARAGEQGRGFAVVAEEVRKLAEQSQTAAKEIADIIRDIQAETNKAVNTMESGVQEVAEGVMVAKDAGDVLDKIQKRVQEVTQLIESIAGIIKSQTNNSNEVAKAVAEVSAITQQAAAGTQNAAAATEETLAAVEEVAASAENLAEIAQNLQSHVAAFKV